MEEQFISLIYLLYYLCTFSCDVSEIAGLQADRIFRNTKVSMFVIICYICLFEVSTQQTFMQLSTSLDV